ncbi:MAG: bacterial transcriptional activator domain-containing protein, partial [Bacteroidota bacterium]
ENRSRNALREVRRQLKIVHPTLITVVNNFYMINPKIEVQTDADQFEKILRRAKQFTPKDVRAETLYLRAISLYEKNDCTGLLPYLYVDWLQQKRSHYESLYIDALKGVAKCAEHRRDYTFAIQCYEKCLKIDEFDEEIYQAMMECLAQNKQQPQVQLLYNRLEKLLHNELDLLPHPDTTALLNRLII